MPPTKYIAKLDPNEIHIGDKILIKGVLQDDAQEFSINFANEECLNPANITYHFKWILDENVIVENYKQNGNWIHHEEKKYDQIDGTIFELEFAFQDDLIDVYKIYENTRNRITSYEPYFEISEIKSLQVWGDVKKISKLSFEYA